MQMPTIFQPAWGYHGNKKGYKIKKQGARKAASGAPRLDSSKLYFGSHSLGEQATRWLKAQRAVESGQTSPDLALEEGACKCIIEFEKKYDDPYSFRKPAIRTFDEEKKVPKVRTGGKVVDQLKRGGQTGQAVCPPLHYWALPSLSGQRKGSPARRRALSQAR